MDAAALPSPEREEVSVPASKGDRKIYINAYLFERYAIVQQNDEHGVTGT